MGYDLHITRKDDWADEDGPTISLAEWVAVVDGDPELRLDGFAEASTADGGTLRIEGEGIAAWTTDSGHGNHGNVAWFSFSQRRGEIVVKSPDDETIAKMVSIAKMLKAGVQGDDGEWYSED